MGARFLPALCVLILGLTLNQIRGAVDRKFG